MATLRRWLDRAKDAAREHVPEPLLDVGRRLRVRVAEHVPSAMQRVLDGTPAAEPRPPDAPGPKLDDAEDAPVVVYATLVERESVLRIREIFRRAGVRVREIDLAAHPRVAQQLAGDTGVQVPPYVYIGGRFWGAEYDILSLEATGDLLPIVEGRLDEISPEARRIGKVRGTYSDDLSVANILERLQLGHILRLDDLDCWLELERGQERLFYQGAPRPVGDLHGIAEEIARAAEAGEIQAEWRFEPEVKLG
jgi:glutaredoxin